VVRSRESAYKPFHTDRKTRAVYRNPALFIERGAEPANIDYEDLAYIEPYFGSSSVFFALIMECKRRETKHRRKK
jgi:hypothetical protein